MISQKIKLILCLAGLVLVLAACEPEISDPTNDEGAGKPPSDVSAVVTAANLNAAGTCP